MPAHEGIGPHTIRGLCFPLNNRLTLPTQLSNWNAANSSKEPWKYSTSSLICNKPWILETLKNYLSSCLAEFKSKFLSLLSSSHSILIAMGRLRKRFHIANDKILRNITRAEQSRKDLNSVAYHLSNSVSDLGWCENSEGKFPFNWVRLLDNSVNCCNESLTEFTPIKHPLK